ncbi:GNAT family N-acetyltransferase [Labrys miyagiensis]|nr:GNAT family N-acetyltransferase [Labrys miyagiensis]
MMRRFGRMSLRQGSGYDGMMLGPTLETPRLFLRPPQPDDLDAWARMLADPVTTRFLSGPKQRSEAWRILTLMTGAWITRGFSTFSVIEKASGLCIGRAGPWQPEGWPGTEIGWVLDRSVWGQGYATEAAARCIAWAYDELDWQEVVHVIDPGNAASIAAAHKLGSERWGKTRLPAPFAGATVDLYGQRRAAAVSKPVIRSAPMRRGGT